MLPVGGTKAAISAGRIATPAVVRTPPVPPDSRSVLILTICLMAAALVGFVLLLFQRRRD